MKQIVKIVARLDKVSVRGKRYVQTAALLDDDEVYYGFGANFSVGDLVMAYWDDKYQKPKMQKPNVIIDNKTDKE